MDYWAETMQDDCYLIAADGWVAETHRVLEEVKSGKTKGEMKDKGWACDLIPKPYIVARYFAKEQAGSMPSRPSSTPSSPSWTELAEEYGGEEGPLKDVSPRPTPRKPTPRRLSPSGTRRTSRPCGKYSALVSEAEECTPQTSQALTDHHHISVLKDSKGKLTLKTVKDRLAATGDKVEQKTLSKYLEAADKQQKAKTKEAADLRGRGRKRLPQAAEGRPAARGLGGPPGHRALPRPARRAERLAGQGQGGRRGARSACLRQVPAAQRQGDQDAGGGRQVAARPGRQRAGRTGSGLVRRSPGASGHLPSATPCRCRSSRMR